ncbi:hypothetical protein [Streptomyces sp. NPDC002851]
MRPDQLEETSSVLTRTAGHGVVRGASSAVGSAGVMLLLWWIQRR